MAGEFTARTWVWLIVVGALAAGATALRIKPRRPLLVGVIAVVPNALPISLLALELPWEILVLAALVTGFGNMLFNTLWETTLQQHIPRASLSRVAARSGSPPRST
jgi:thiamine transporter ThiT